jgi:hypothetical protein
VVQEVSGDDRWSAWDERQTGSREPHVVELAREAMSWGMDIGRVIERLRTRIKRDEQYLAYRERKGQHTPTDDAIASDLRVLALAICYLEQRR